MDSESVDLGLLKSKKKLCFFSALFSSAKSWKEGNMANGHLKTWNVPSQAWKMATWA
jgi:hypothetical protein